jgi:glycosyltransferase A (GT-A) superfamily protein (DUF2064 family)
MAECFMRDMLTLLGGLSIGLKSVAYQPDEARDYFRELVKPLLEFSTFPQKGNDPGERLMNILQHEFAAGANHVVILESDSPTLPAEYITQAFEGLKKADFVLGPTFDGGIYLVGASLPSATPFTAVPWFTPQVFKKMVHNISSAGLRLSLTPPWYDVDTEHGYEMLRTHLKAMTYAGVKDTATHTAAWLTTMENHPSR